MNSWAPLWSGLVDSSIWEEDDHVFRVFMAMLSLKDSNHIVSMDGYRLAKRIHMEVKDVEAALKVLSKPDKKRPDQPLGGIRIKKVDDGWEIVNGEFYRKLVSDEMRRARNRRAQAAHRARKAAAKVNGVPRNVPTYGEQMEDRAAREEARRPEKQADFDLPEPPSI